MHWRVTISIKNSHMKKLLLLSIFVLSYSNVFANWVEVDKTTDQVPINSVSSAFSVKSIWDGTLSARIIDAFFLNSQFDIAKDNLCIASIESNKTVFCGKIVTKEVQKINISNPSVSSSGTWYFLEANLSGKVEAWKKYYIWYDLIDKEKIVFKAWKNDYNIGEDIEVSSNEISTVFGSKIRDGISFFVWWRQYFTKNGIISASFKASRPWKMIIPIIYTDFSSDNIKHTFELNAIEIKEWDFYNKSNIDVVLNGDTIEITAKEKLDGVKISFWDSSVLVDMTGLSKKYSVEELWNLLFKTDIPSWKQSIKFVWFRNKDMIPQYWKERTITIDFQSYKEKREGVLLQSIWVSSGSGTDLISQFNEIYSKEEIEKMKNENREAIENKKKELEALESSSGNFGDTLMENVWIILFVIILIAGSISWYLVLKRKNANNPPN